MKLYTADKETGTIIEEVASIEEGLKKIAAYEESDKKDGVFEADFYDVINEERITVL